MFKKIGIGIVAALIVAAVGVGVVLAQGSTPVTETPTAASDPGGPSGDHGPGGRGGRHGPMGGGQLDSRASFDALAEALGMTTEELREALADGQTIAELAEAKGVVLEDIAAALVTEHTERLQQAVEDGRLTQEEADAKLAEMEANILEQLESGEFGHFGGPGMPGEARGPMGGGQLDVVAEALGMTTDELRDALADGQTIADLAEAKGVPLEDIAAALVAEHTERLQQAVESGRLTQEEADAKLAEMEANILEHLESGGFVGPGGPGGPGECECPGGTGSGPRGGGMHGPRFSDSEAPASEE